MLPPAAMSRPEAKKRTAPTITQELKHNRVSDQGCEPTTSVKLEVLDMENRLIDWDAKVMLPTLPNPESSIPSSPLVLPSTKTISSPSIEIVF